MSDNLYGFRSPRPIADSITVIINIICEIPNNKLNMRTNNLDISNASDNVWHLWKGFPKYHAPLTGMFMQVISNSQSSETHDINAGVPQCSLIGPTLFYFYNNEIPQRILRSLGNIYAGGTTVYRSTSNY